MGRGPDCAGGPVRLVGPGQTHPYLEQTAVYNALDLTVPLTGGPNQGFKTLPQNVFGVSVMVGLFLCPSDRKSEVRPGFGPTNYVTCVGSGTDGGLGKDTDGCFFVNSAIRIADVRDGTSSTILMSESLLGPGGTVASTPTLEDGQTQHADPGPGKPVLSAGICQSTPSFGNWRNGGWASGAYSGTFYNHLYPPNHSEPDCYYRSVPTPAWKGARSRHPGGIHVLLGDGGVRLTTNAISLPLWRALATRASGEVVSNF